MISYVYCSDHPDCYPSVREVVSLVVVLSLSSRPNARASVQHGFVQLERFNNCADGDCFMGTDSSLCASVHAASLHAFFRLFFARLLSTVSRAVPLYVIFLDAESLPQMPNQSQTPEDPSQFLMMGFMVLPVLFVVYGIFQHLFGRRRVDNGSDDAAPSKPSSSNGRQGPPGPGPSGTT